MNWREIAKRTVPLLFSSGVWIISSITTEASKMAAATGVQYVPIICSTMKTVE